MPKFKIFIKADLENVTHLRPQDINEYDWKFKFRCTKCQEEHAGWVTVNASEEVEQSNTRGVANLVMRCKSCKNEGTANVLVDTLEPYTLESSGRFAPLVQIECRGLEPFEWAPADGWQAEGAESETPFTDIPLGEGEEWAEYDEKASEPVGVTELVGKVEKA
ncbi:uncharacterized protein SPPG_00623 [Spizellomyces punctatus DAOM BR117]|uniref:DUF866 domain-containing protein n=1 Tax=Spizellomyces punctatus (strain DAOM BR117) TaxID=645134 RepID=A0A0L0HUY6_SPIPD|nr:uncharacterized protein SPPG_00623 [Spizellomyces punctatus DAOM BR117]KND04933.1 hypothetical protein SPPG_00623 [Spizellomyces punctatus DAOM BR117]|eukprot:XP_016612972.1 hypothetical protein SPPG_00623 [Spizellomyces punctatus DAOM BR117]